MIQLNVKQVLLSIASINIFDKNNKSHYCRIFLDRGTQPNFIAESLCNKLNVKDHHVIHQ